MDSRVIIPKELPKPLLLKDYLLDDMSSCSSNGFKSFPRIQCSTSTVRFLIDIDLKNKQQKKYLNFSKNPQSPLKNPSKSALAAFHSVITAVKRLPFGSASSPEKRRLKRSILPRNLSKKILKKSSFWKRKSNHKEIEPWESFDQLLKEEREPSDIYNSSMTTSDSKSKSWSGSDFTVSDECSSGNSSSEVNISSPEIKNDAVGVLKNGDVSTDSTSSCDSNSSTKQKQWSVNEEKEQSSPVSVLDCPFDDDDEEVSSPFQDRLARMEGTKKKLMKKIQRFECLAQLEPVNLARRFAFLPDSDNESTESPLQHSSASNVEKSISDIEEEQEEHEENQAEQKALDLLHQMKDTLPSCGLKIKADKLLLDFFTEKIITQKQGSGYSFEEELFEEAENWINRREPRDLFLEWKVPKNRLAYIKDMEKDREWRSLDQENQEVASELETEVFAALLDELLLDISSKAKI